MVPGYDIKTGSEWMDLQSIHAFISKSYWAAGIPLETLQKALENSLCFGVFTSTGKQVGFARLITDYATFAYLADVYIDNGHRGQGLSKWLMKEIHGHPAVTGLRRIMLATNDAHDLYAQSGYTALKNPAVFMEKWNPDIYTNPVDS